MVAKTFVADEILTASDVNTYLVNRWVKIIPNSVSGSGVSLSADGDVTFTSATSIGVLGCFSSDFRNYRIYYDSSGTAATLSFRLLVGSTPSTTNYDRTELVARNATVSSSTVLNGTSGTIIGFANTLMQADIDISGPNLAIPTTMLTRGAVHANPAVQNTANGLVTNYITHRPSTAYNGFDFTLSNAQSGQITIYGIG